MRSRTSFREAINYIQWFQICTLLDESIWNQAVVIMMQEHTIQRKLPHKDTPKDEVRLLQLDDDCIVPVKIREFNMHE